MNLKQIGISREISLRTKDLNPALTDPVTIMDSFSPEDRQKLINKYIQMRIVIHRKLKEKRG